MIAGRIEKRPRGPRTTHKTHCNLLGLNIKTEYSPSGFSFENRRRVSSKSIHSTHWAIFGDFHSSKRVSYCLSVSLCLIIRPLFLISAIGGSLLTMDVWIKCQTKIYCSICSVDVSAMRLLILINVLLSVLQFSTADFTFYRRRKLYFNSCPCTAGHGGSRGYAQRGFR